MKRFLLSVALQALCVLALVLFPMTTGAQTLAQFGAPPSQDQQVVDWTAFTGIQGGRPDAAQPPPDAAAAGPTRVQGGIGMLAAAPLGEFGTNIDSAGGFSGHLAVSLGESVVTLGGEAAYLWYGEESRKVPLSTTIPDLVVTVNTDNAMFLLHGRVRAQPRQGRWRPYVDGLFGFTDIFTKTSIERTDCNAFLFVCEPLLESTNSRDFALSYGGGAGVMVGFGFPPSAARLDISLRYLRGGEAEYLREGAIRREGGQAFFDFSRSRTDMVMLYIGVAVGR